MSEPSIESAIPVVRVTSFTDAMPLYKALGFRVYWQHRLTPDGPRLTSVVLGGAELYLTEHPVAPFEAVIYFVVHGLDELVERARARGFAPSFGPEEREWGDREAYFTDVDGNVLRLGESKTGEQTPAPGTA